MNWWWIPILCSRLTASILTSQHCKPILYAIDFFFYLIYSVVYIFTWNWSIYILAACIYQCDENKNQFIKTWILLLNLSKFYSLTKFQVGRWAVVVSKQGKPGPSGVTNSTSQSHAFLLWLLTLFSHLFLTVGW
jgi:hypothetical protein